MFYSRECSVYTWIERMSLSSVLNTAHSGMTAAVTSLEAASHNLANSQTNGFKSVRPTFAEQTPSTQNGRQIGTGVQVTGIETDNSQGSLVARPDGSTVELSNTDVGEELVQTIMASDQFAANASVFSTASGMLDTLLSLGRPR